MIKGCQKKILHITNPKSRYFEEAYFIFKRGGDLTSVSGDSIVKEASRLADEALRTVKPHRARARRQGFLALLMGIATASIIFGAVMLFYTVTA